MWNSSDSLGSSTAMFTHIINGNYGDMMGSGLDWLNDAQPPVNDTNVAMFAGRFAGYVTQLAPPYQGPIMAVWGSDFQFGNATVQVGLRVPASDSV